MLRFGDMLASGDDLVREFPDVPIIGVLSNRRDSPAEVVELPCVTAVDSDGALDGGTALPGFKLSLADLLAKVGPRAWSNRERERRTAPQQPMARRSVPRSHRAPARAPKYRVNRARSAVVTAMPKSMR